MMNAISLCEKFNSSVYDGEWCSHIQYIAYIYEYNNVIIGISFINTYEYELKSSSIASFLIQCVLMKYTCHRITAVVWWSVTCYCGMMRSMPVNKRYKTTSIFAIRFTSTNIVQLCFIRTSVHCHLYLFLLVQRTTQLMILL